MRVLSAMGVAILSAGFAQSALAADQTVAAEKKAPALDKLIEPTSSSLEYRHYFNFAGKDADLVSVDPAAQVRANVGFNLLGKLDTLAIFGATKYTGDQKLVQRTPQIWSQLEVQKNESLSTYLFADIRTPMAGNDTSARIGVNPVYNATVATTRAAAFSVISYNELFFSTGADTKKGVLRDKDAARPDGLTLVKADGAEVNEWKKGQPDLGALAELYAAAVPTWAPKLKLQAGLAVSRDWTPKYSLNENQEQVTTMVGETATTTRASVSYKITDTFSVKNTTDHNINGFYQAGLDGDGGSDLGTRRLLNYTTLSYTLF